MEPLIGWVEADASGRYAATIPEGPGCEARRYPATFYAVVEPPAGRYFTEAGRPVAVALESPTAELVVDWKRRTAPARASVCGGVEARGRGLPFGFLSLLPSEGGTDKSLVRVKDGKFCAAGVAPGDYAVNVIPPLIPSPQANELLPEPLISGSLSVGERSPGPLDLVYRGPEPTSRPVELKGRLKAAPPGPVFIFVRTDQGAPTWRTTDHLFWLEGEGEDRPFAVPLAPGRMLNLWAASGDMTIVGLRYTKPLDPMASAGSELEITLGPSARVSGDVFAAGGARFRPRLSRDARARRLFAVRYSTFWEDDHGDGAFADSEGHYEAARLRPGFYRLWPVTGAAGFEESVGAPRAVWAAAGQASRLDWTLSAWAIAAVSPDGEFPAALGDSAPPRANTVPLNYTRPLERWIVGVKPGRLDETAVSGLLLNDEAPINFLQDSRGGWLPRRAWDRRRPSSGVRVAPGRYDVYLLEVADRYHNPSLRVLALEKGVPIRAGEAAALKFPAPRYPRGTGTLRGELKTSRPPTPAGFRRASSLAELHALLTPRVQLYDARGRFAAAAFVGVSYVDMGEAIEAAGKDDAAALEKAAKHWSHGFIVEGLAAGRYTAELSAAGYKTRRTTVEIEPDATTVLDADLDRP
jgi:hypothetical protein